MHTNVPFPPPPSLFFFFFFNDTATTEIYTLSLHERSSDLSSSAPSLERSSSIVRHARAFPDTTIFTSVALGDRKSTRLNSSHSQISYAVFCLKKKNISLPPPRTPDLLAHTVALSHAVALI